MLKEFLENKPLYYTEIDYARMPKVYEKIKSHFKISKIVHIIGTNGKGTTGRFLAAALVSKGFKAGHYTSPHIVEFNERIWLNGDNVSNKELESAHKQLQLILSEKESAQLSYFEYTTFLAMLIFNECEYIILEAGLGGEHDATAVFPKILTLVTPIDLDHEAFLGNSIHSIATTKLNAMQKSVILANQKFPEVTLIAKDIALKKGAQTYTIKDFLDTQDEKKINEISEQLSLVNYLKENLKLSISALKFLKINYSSENFENARLFGRLSKIAENVTVDVGHNPLAAHSIVEALEGKKYILVYNSYKDKDYKEILRILKPIIWHVEIINIVGERVESKEFIQRALNELEIKYSEFKALKPDKEYLVFGSFAVVETFLREYNE